MERRPLDNNNWNGTSKRRLLTGTMVWVGSGRFTCVRLRLISRFLKWNRELSHSPDLRPYVSFFFLPKACYSFVHPIYKRTIIKMIFSFFSYEKTPISKDLDAHSTLKALHWKGYPPLLDWDAFLSWPLRTRVLVDGGLLIIYATYRDGRETSKRWEGKTRDTY